MYNRILLILLLGLCSRASACDICSIYSAIEPNSFKSRIGITYRSSFYQGKPLFGLKHGGFNDYIVKEIYDYYELSGRYFHQKSGFAIQGVLPVVNRYRSLNSNTQSDNWGFGDLKIQVIYRVINSKKTDSSKAIHRLEIGLGVKMPLGLTNRQSNGMLSDIDMQPGTGSWDLFASLQYVLKVKSFGFALEGSYQMNNNGRTGYHFGDMVSLKTRFFYLWKKKDWVLSPSIGLDLDIAMEDRYLGALYLDSGAMVFGGNLGFNVYWKSIQLNGSFAMPMVQYFKGYETPLKYRFSVGLIYNI